MNCASVTGSGPLHKGRCVLENVVAHAPGKDGWAVMGIAAVSLALRLALAARCGIFQDEGIYWWDAQRAGTGFCPSPPVTALAVQFGTAVLGHGVLGLRLGALVAGTLTLVAAYVAGRDLFGGRAGLWAAGLLAVCPFFVSLGTVTTPEPFLVLAWLVFMWTAWRGANGAGLLWWGAAGLALAAGLYSKYMMVLALPSLLVALVAEPAGRQALRRPGPWLSAGLGLALFVPAFLWWNARNEWAAARFHLASRHDWTLSWGLIARYFLGHAGVLSPIIYLGVFAALVVCFRAWWRRRDRAAVWVLAFGVLPILFFIPPSMFTRWTTIREHWDIVGYAAGMLGLAAIIDGFGRVQRRPHRALGVLTVGSALLVSAFVAVAVILPQTAIAIGTRPPTRKMLGWDRLADRVRQLTAQWDGPAPFLVTESFTEALCLGFHLPEQGHIFTLDHERNHDYGLVEQLRMWGIDEGSLLAHGATKPILYVHEYRIDDHDNAIKDPLDRFHTFFAVVEPLDEVIIRLAGQPVRAFGLFRCSGLRPNVEPRPARPRG